MIWRTITQLQLTSEQESEFVNHDALQRLMTHDALRLGRVGKKLFKRDGELKLDAWADATDRDRQVLPVGSVKSPNASLDSQWDRDERYGGGRRRSERKKKDLG